jgi:hypothetical protein
MKSVSCMVKLAIIFYLPALNPEKINFYNNFIAIQLLFYTYFYFFLPSLIQFTK